MWIHRKLSIRATPVYLNQSTVPVPVQYLHLPFQFHPCIFQLFLDRPRHAHVSISKPTHNVQIEQKNIFHPAARARADTHTHTHTHRTACSRTIKATALMHWSLLVVASSLGNEEYIPPLRAPNQIKLPPCALFLAPSTIPGSACMRTYKTTKFCVLCGLLLFHFFFF